MAPTQPFPHLHRTFRLNASLRRLANSCITLMAFALSFCSAVHAQGGVSLSTVVTDQSPLNLSNQFGIPAGAAVNQAGDFAFVGAGGTALFLRPAGSTVATRVLQVSDPVPGITGGQVQGFSSSLAINASGLLLFQVRYLLADGSNRSALMTFDGKNFQTIVSSSDIAPGSGGANYTLGFIPGGLNDSGDISFSDVPLKQNSARTVYIVPSGGPAVRVAATNDVPPPECTWCTPPGGTIPVISPFTVPFNPPINALGQVLVSFAGGLFIGSKSGLTLVPIASSGLCGPPVVPSSSNPGSFLGGNPESALLFEPANANAALNNAGAVAFLDTTASATAICLVPAGGAAPVPEVASGGLGPASIGGGTFSAVSFTAMDDSGNILFEAPMTGATTSYALLRFHPSNQQMDAVAYNGEALGSPSGASIASPAALISTGTQTTSIPLPGFRAISTSSDGRVSFNASLTQGGNAIYQQTGSSMPALVAAEGQAVPVSGGGNLEVQFTTQTETLTDGSTYFPAYFTNSSGDFAVLVGTPGSLQAVMSTGDTLPAGARTTIGTAAPKIAGHYVAFIAQPAGGIANLLESDLSAGTTTLITSNGQIIVPNANFLPGATSLTPNFFVNKSGQVAFQIATGNLLSLSGVGSISFGISNSNDAWLPSESFGCGAIYQWSPSSGLSKIVVPGDVVPILGSTVSCAALNSGPPSPLNDAGQVVFSASILGPASTTNPQFGGLNTGVFLYSPANEIGEFAVTGNVLPLETQPTTLVPSIPAALSSKGQAAFGAQVGTISSGPFVGVSSGFQGFFLEDGSGAFEKIVASGDAVPGTSSTFGFPHYISGLDDNADLAFTAATSTAIDGVFFAPANGSIRTLAVDGGPVPGAGGGTFSLTFPVTLTLPPGVIVLSNPFGEIALMNNESDIAFRAGITGGSANSGYFRMLQAGSTAGVLLPIVLQGQAAPGGGIFVTLPEPTSLSPNFSLGPDGSLAFINQYVSNTGMHVGIYAARQDGTLLKVMASGDAAAGGGVVRSLGMSYGLAAGGAGKFVFLSGIEGGSASEAIYVASIPPVAAATTTALVSSQVPSVYGQPVTLTATVSSATPGAITGNVNFVADGILLGTSAVAGGHAALTVSTLSVGPHSVAAFYSGDTNFALSESTALAQPVGTRTTTTAVVSSLNPAVAGQGMSFTATVATSAGGGPTGSVSFLDGGTSIGTATLDGNGVATLSAGFLNIASHPITASYGGDLNSAPSVSPAVMENVVIAAIIPPSTPLRVTAGQSLTIPLTIMAASGSNLTFTLSCSGLPAGTSCMPASNPVSAAAPPNGTGVQLTFSTTSRSGIVSVGIRKWPFAPGGFGLAAALAALLAATVLSWWRAPRWRLASCACLAVFVLALAIGGCGASNYSSSPPAPIGTPAGLATFTVTGTSSTATISTVVKVTVQ